MAAGKMFTKSALVTCWISGAFLSATVLFLCVCLQQFPSHELFLSATYFRKGWNIKMTNCKLGGNITSIIMYETVDSIEGAP